MQGSNGDTDIENRFVDTVDEEEGGMNRERSNETYTLPTFSSVQFSRSVVSDSLRPHELQHSRPPCPSPTPEFTQTHVHQVSDAIQPSHPLSSPFPPAPNPSQHQSFPMSQLFASGGQSTGVSVSCFKCYPLHIFLLRWLRILPC